MPARQIACRADDISLKTVLHFVRFTRVSPPSPRRRELLPKTRESQNDGRIPVMRHAGHGLTTQRTTPWRYRQSPHGGDAKPRILCKTSIEGTSHTYAVIHTSPFSAPIIPSRFAPRSPVMRHHPIPFFHYSKRHGQILSMPQNIFQASCCENRTSYHQILLLIKCS